ncbi:uncharacterized protein PG986_010330 [Apiospora aurea]|uniref:MYND-type domain-containing protein n=1 Tax=Apiospora aurea TaxID=335848 RepID=A0ABR1Q1Y9_9PEZI
MSLEPIGANRPCDKPGTASCGSCRMVLYCNQKCQKAHWPQHKADCKSDLLKSTWLPEWDIQRRIPTFMASGDLRNVFKPIVAAPSNYKAKLQITINDRDIYIVARTVLMLLLLLVEKDPVAAAQNAVHLWYSAFIAPSLMNTLKTKIEPLLRAVCAKIEHGSDCSLLGKTFGFPSGNLRVLLNKRSWNSLLDYTKVPDIPMAQAQEQRRAVMLAPSRLDYRARAYHQQDPPTRFGAQKFRERGILLPLGAPTEAFTIPNPTLFTSSGGWPLTDSSDPRNGWLMSHIRKCRTAAAVNDIFGQLYYHVVDLTSNIADMAYWNPVVAVARLGPLLKPLNVNPHATIMALFMNAIPEMKPALVDGGDLHNVMRQINQYLPLSPARHFYDDSYTRMLSLADMFIDFDGIFDRYMRGLCVAPMLSTVGTEMKAEHTVVEKWPMRLKKRPGQDGAQEEFQDLSYRPQTMISTLPRLPRQLAADASKIRLVTLVLCDEARQGCKLEVIPCVTFSLRRQNLGYLPESRVSTE